jgi:hypothetical protein
LSAIFTLSYSSTLLSSRCVRTYEHTNQANNSPITLNSLRRFAASLRFCPRSIDKSKLLSNLLLHTSTHSSGRTRPNPEQNVWGMLDLGPKSDSHSSLDSVHNLNCVTLLRRSPLQTVSCPQRFNKRFFDCDRTEPKKEQSFCFIQFAHPNRRRIMINTSSLIFGSCFDCSFSVQLT